MNDIVNFPEQESVEGDVNVTANGKTGSEVPHQYESFNAGEEENLIETDDAIGEPASELESAVDGEGTTVEEESSSNLADIVNSIDDIAKSLECQKQIFNAKAQLEQICFSMGVTKDDQEFLNEKFQTLCYTKEYINNIVSDKDKLDATFFTREDGSIIHLTTLTGDNNQYEAKKELVEYLYGFYDLEKSVQHDLDELNEDIKKFKREDVASASATVANNLKVGIEDRWTEMEALPDDDPEKKERRNLLSRLKSSYTFADLIAVMEKYPSVVKSAFRDVDNAERIKEIGKRYATKLKQGNTFSKLYGIFQDDISKSIEKQFLHEDDYVAGRENFFAFFLVRFFATETWTKGSTDCTRELHNATCIVLNNLLAGTLDTEFRDEVVANIKTVWKKFKELM